MGVNRLEIAGRVVETGGLRHTPAGLASCQLRLAHASDQREAGRTRRAECEVDAQAFGDVAAALARQAVGSDLRLVGFLDRRNARNPQPMLHVTEFELIQE